MKARTLVELLTLSSNLYLVAKDKELFEKLEKMAEAGKEKASGLFHKAGHSGEDEEQELLQRIHEKARQAREELEERVAELAANVYRKMHIAHASEVEALGARIEDLKKELALAEARLVNLENKVKV
jgi:polyhydroxyalkanoate synthesis regulator phasin